MEPWIIAMKWPMDQFSLRRPDLEFGEYVLVVDDADAGEVHGHRVGLALVRYAGEPAGNDLPHDGLLGEIDDVALPGVALHGGVGGFHDDVGKLSRGGGGGLRGASVVGVDFGDDRDAGIGFRESLEELRQGLGDLLLIEAHGQLDALLRLDHSGEDDEGGQDDEQTFLHECSSLSMNDILLYDSSVMHTCAR
jgi:hypothetical protein